MRWAGHTAESSLEPEAPDAAGLSQRVRGGAHPLEPLAFVRNVPTGMSVGLTLVGRSNPTLCVGPEDDFARRNHARAQVAAIAALGHRAWRTLEVVALGCLEAEISQVDLDPGALFIDALAHCGAICQPKELVFS